jgi:Holliday junction resolvasome RuvABC endonuclease subunit
MILSIDASCSKTGWAILNENQELIKYGLIKYTNKNKGKVLLNSYNAISNILKENTNIDHVIFEDQHNQFFKAFKSLVEFRGALLLAIYLFKIDMKILYITPSHIRKVVLGRGNVDKEEVSQFISDKYGIDFMNMKENNGRDITDAIVIGLSYILEGDTSGKKISRTRTKRTDGNRVKKSKKGWD